MTVPMTDLGPPIHQVAGFDAAKAREAPSIPEGSEPVAAIAVGYLGDPESLPENLRAGAGRACSKASDGNHF